MSIILVKYKSVVIVNAVEVVMIRSMRRGYKVGYKECIPKCMSNL